MGLAFAAVAAFSFATMSIFVRIARQRGGTDNGVIAALVVNVGLHGLVVFGRILLGSRIEWVAVGVGWFIVSGILTTLMGRLALYAGIERIGAARAAPIKNLAPFVTVGMAVGLLGEQPSPTAAFGVALALTSYLVFVVEGTRSVARRAPVVAAVPMGTAGQTGGGATREERRTFTSAADGTEHTNGTDAVRRFSTLSAAGYAACTVAASFYGAGTIVRKVGVSAMPDPYAGAFVSAASGLVVYVLYLWARGQLGDAAAALVAERQPYYWLAGVASTAGQLSLFVALSLTAASVVSVVSASDTIITVVLGAAFLGRSEAVNRWVVLAAIGVAVATVVIALG